MSREDGLEMVKVDPVDVRGRGANDPEYEYQFQEAFPDEVPPELVRSLPADVTKTEKGLTWKFDGKVEVEVRPDGVYAPEQADRKSAQNQAYFALSYLADEGYVSRFEKV